MSQKFTLLWQTPETEIYGGISRSKSFQKAHDDDDETGLFPDLQTYWV